MVNVKGVLDFGDTSNLAYLSPLREFTLGDLTISIKLFYSLVDEGIYMNIYDSDDNPISYGNRLVPNVGLLSKLKYKTKSNVDLVIMSSSEEHKSDNITVDNFGKEMKMYYVENV